MDEQAKHMKSARKFNEENERIKRAYLRYLRNAKGHSETSVAKSADAILRLETVVNFKSFATLNIEDAEAFRDHLTNHVTDKTGKPLAAVSRVNMQVVVRAFVHWLADQKGYKSKITHSFADYFGPLKKELRVAHAGRLKPAATPEQAAHAFRQMPTSTVFERRDRTLFAFMVLTGARIDAVASLKIGHVDMVEGCVFQDGAEVRTKFSKTFTTWFLPVEQVYEDCLADWIKELTEEQLFGPSDPLFPKPKMQVSPTEGFEIVGLSREHYKTNDSLRKFIKQTFTAAGLPPFTPHRFRNTLVEMSNRYVTTAEELKAVSMNLGHSSVQMTVDGYGKISPQRQGEVIKQLRAKVRNAQSKT
ncbi:MAG: site-specific integrase [Pseudomonadota bacterium]